MRVIAILSLMLLLTLAVFLGMRLGPHFRFSAWTGSGGATHKPQAPPGQAKTNPPPAPPEGFYVGKGEQRVFIKYGTTDPLLRTVLQSVMDGSSDPRKQGREIYLRICAACHQPDGEGKEGLAPPLVGSEWALAPGGGRLVRLILNGLTGPVKVRGKDWNLTMPPWREALTDDQVAVVLTYVRLELGSEHAGRITPEFVADVRKEARTKPETAEELLQISDQ